MIAKAHVPSAPRRSQAWNLQEAAPQLAVERPASAEELASAAEERAWEVVAVADAAGPLEAALAEAEGDSKRAGFAEEAGRTC